MVHAGGLERAALPKGEVLARLDYPSGKNQRFLPAPLTRGAEIACGDNGRAMLAPTGGTVDRYGEVWRDDVGIVPYEGEPRSPAAIADERCSPLQGGR